MKIYEQHFSKEIYVYFTFISCALCSLLLLLDLISEFSTLSNQSSLLYITLSALLRIPGHVYDIAPIAGLISAIYALAQSASLSEWIIFRLAGLCPLKALILLMKIGLPIFLFTFLLGEFCIPFSDQLTNRLKSSIVNPTFNLKLPSGIWLRNTLKDPILSKNIIININKLTNNMVMKNVTIYEFTDSLILKSILHAETGIFIHPDHWKLNNLTKISFQKTNHNKDTSVESKKLPTSISIATKSEELIKVDLTSKIVSVIALNHNRMSIRGLATFIHYLKHNKQGYQKYEVAFWKKIFYPVGILVMMSLSLPFAYLHARSGLIGVKVFGGILIGLSFLLINTLFSHIGILSTWPVPLTTAIPSVLYSLLALTALRWISRQ